MVDQDKIKNTNLKVVSMYSDDGLTEGESYDVIEIETFTLEKPHNGATTKERIFLLKIVCDTGKIELFKYSDFEMSEELRRELKLRMLAGHSSITEEVSKLSKSKLLDLISTKY